MSKDKSAAAAGSLYDQLQKNKQEREIDFYEETKSESVRGLSDEDAKFLASLHEAQMAKEKELRAANEAELQVFKERHDRLSREAIKRAEETARAEALRVAAAASISKETTSVKKVVKSTSASTKRQLLGINPIKRAKE